MTLIVKIMSAEDTADHDTRKGHALLAGVKSAHFERRGDGTSADPRTFTRPWLTLHFTDGETESFEPRGNVYVMNERGQTIDSYGVAPIIYADADLNAEHPGRPPAEARKQWTRGDTARALNALKQGATAYTIEGRIDLRFDDAGAHEVLSQIAADFDGSDATIKAAVERFLRWRLPESFNPDNGISFAKPTGVNAAAHWPIGTNLFDYTQAEAMLRHVFGLTRSAPSA